MIARKVLEKCDNKFENLDVNGKFPYLKASAIGAVEGLIDAAVIIGVVDLGVTIAKIVTRK